MLKRTLILFCCISIMTACTTKKEDEVKEIIRYVKETAENTDNTNNNNPVEEIISNSVYANKSTGIYFSYPNSFVVTENENQVSIAKKIDTENLVFMELAKIAQNFANLEELKIYLESNFSEQNWQIQSYFKNGEGFYTIIETEDKVLRHYVVLDDQNRAISVKILVASPHDEEGRLLIAASKSVLLDLQSPTIESIELDKSEAFPGDTVTLRVKISDDIGFDFNTIHTTDRLIAENKGPASWFGYNIEHDTAKYSLAYAYPLGQVQLVTYWDDEEEEFYEYYENVWFEKVGENEFEYKFKVPNMAPIGEIVLAGLKVNDYTGKESYLTLDSLAQNQNANFATTYTVAKGNITAHLEKRSFQVLRPESDPNYVGDTNPPQIISIGFMKNSLSIGDKQMFNYSIVDEESIFSHYFDYALRIEEDDSSELFKWEGCFQPCHHGCKEDGSSCYMHYQNHSYAGCFDSIDTEAKVSLNHFRVFDSVGNMTEFISSVEQEIPSFLITR